MNEAQLAWTLRTMRVLCHVVAVLAITYLRLCEATFVVEDKTSPEDKDRATLRTKTNYFTYAGELFVASDLLEVRLHLDLDKDTQHDRANRILNALNHLSQKVKSSARLNETRPLLLQQLENCRRRVVTSRSKVNEAITELNLNRNPTDTKGESRLKRDIFSNLASIILGWNSWQQDKRMNKIAEGMVATSEAVTLNRKGLDVLCNYTDRLVEDEREFYAVEFTWSQLMGYTDTMVKEAEQLVDLLRSLARGKLHLDSLPFDHFTQILSHLTEELEKLNLRNVEGSLLTAPFQAKLNGTQLVVLIYLAVQPLHVPVLEAFHPHESIFDYNGTLVSTGEPEHVLIGVTENQEWNAALTLEQYGACRRQKGRIICFNVRAISNTVDSCAVARYQKRWDKALELCKLHPVKKKAFWFIRDRDMQFIGEIQRMPPVQEHCQGNRTVALHDDVVTFSDNCVYYTPDLVIFANSKLTVSLDVERSFHTDFRLHELPPLNRDKLMHLKFDNYRAFDKEDFDVFTLFSNKLVLVLAGLAVLCLSGLAALATCAWKHRQELFRLAEIVEPEIAAANDLVKVTPPPSSSPVEPLQPKEPPGEDVYAAHDSKSLASASRALVEVEPRYETVGSAVSLSQRQVKTTVA